MWLTFKWKSGLDTHVKSQHVGQYKCFKCRWSFRTKEKFTAHIKAMHKGYDDTTMNTIKKRLWIWSDDDKSDTEDTNSEKEESYHRMTPSCYAKYVTSSL